MPSATMAQPFGLDKLGAVRAWALSQALQAEGLNHRSRGQRPRTSVASQAFALKGQSSGQSHKYRSSYETPYFFKMRMICSKSDFW